MDTLARSSGPVHVNVLDLPAIASRSGGSARLGESRRFAALVALVFPLLTVVLVVGGVVRIAERPAEALTHPLFIAMLVPGAAALVFWLQRYTRPALRALASRSPIMLEHGAISILGQSFPIMGGMMLRYDRSMVELVSDGRILSRKPGFFIRIDEKLGS